MIFGRRKAGTAAPAAAPPQRPGAIPPGVMRAIRRIAIQTRRLVNQGVGGEYHSVFKGRGMEFSEVREYLAGDDVRTIDWNVTSRTGALHIKKYVEERELTVMLVVDVSGSGDFGTGSHDPDAPPNADEPKTKRELAAWLAALLTLAALRNHDRVGLVLFTDHVETHVPPAKGSEHAFRVVREVLAHRPSGHGTDLAGALRSVTHSLKKRAIVFVISDFRAEGWEFPLRVAAQKHDVACVRVVDARERSFEAVGLLEVVDAETGARRIVDTSRRAWREEYARRFAEHEARCAAIFRRHGIDSFSVDVGPRWHVPLVNFFRARERRSRHA